MKLLLCVIGIIFSCSINRVSGECMTDIGKVEVVSKAGKAAVLPCASAVLCEGNFTHLTWGRYENSQEIQELLSWSKNDSDSGDPKTLSDVKYTLLANKSMLIEEVNIDLTGKYKCKAQKTVVSANSAVPDATHTFTDEVDLTVIDRPSAPPDVPVITDVTNTSLRVSWKPSEVNYSRPISYIVEYNSTNMKKSENTAATEVVLHSLKPYTQYTVRVFATNDAGPSTENSGWSRPVRTLSGAPTQDAKPEISREIVANTSITLEFEKPAESEINGELKGFELQYRPSTHKNWTAVLIGEANNYTISDLTPYTMYTISLRITNDLDLNGPAVLIHLMTKPGMPSKPSILAVTSQTATSFEVRWNPPKEHRGMIIKYVLKWDSDPNNEHSMTLIFGPQLNLSPLRYNITGLSYETRYSITLTACTGEHLCGPAAYSSGHTDVQVPGPLAHVNVSTNASTSLTVRWNRPKFYSGNIDFYMIAYTVFGDTRKKLEPADSPLKKMQDSFEVYLDKLEENAEYSVQMAAGTQSFFHYKDGNIEMPLIYWGPYSSPQTIQLMNDKKEEAAMSGSLVGAILGVALTLIVLIVLILGFLYLRKRLKKKHDYKEVEQNVDLVPVASTYGTRRRSLRSDTPPRRDCIPICEFERHVVKNHADGDLLFSQEFDDINQNTRTDLTSKHSLELENRLKNRYINILAYDHTRVLLRPIGGTPHSDYINANYIEGFEKPRAYIATQGPLTNTFNDFWRMVWEQNVAVIVMITNLTEKARPRRHLNYANQSDDGQVTWICNGDIALQPWNSSDRKCDQYWPTDGEHVYNNIHVTLLEESITAHYIVRKFKLKYAKDRLSIKKKLYPDREITQFHFTEWPDHGVPNYSLPVLQFVIKSIAAIPENSGPPVIHCSAGVGRTGTYIVIDSMMKQILVKKTVNVFSFLSHIRNQRNYMVQTEDQYVFIHDVLLEYIHSGETEVKDFGIVQYIKDLMKRDSKDGSLLEKQYKLVTSFEPKEFHIHSSQSAVNKEKNRSLCIVPDEMSRVRLPMKPGVPGSDYINASYLQGYNKTEEFIVTQHPMESTVEDFWRMVWDHNSMTVVLLSEPLMHSHEQEYAAFWPGKEEDKEYGHFQIAYTGETQQGNFLCRDFLLQSTQDDYECTTRIISTTTPWPKSCNPVHTVFDLVDSVRHWHNQHDVEGPIVVVDSHGGQEAATLCALTALKEQLDQEHSIDVYSTAKLYHLKRPGLFSGATSDSQPGQDAYMFLYKAMQTYSEMSSQGTDRDSGIGNGVHHYQNSTLNRDTMLALDPIPSARSPDKMPPPAVVRSMSRSSTLVRGSQSEAMRDSLKDTEA